jgi:hypothetical protein
MSRKTFQPGNDGHGGGRPQGVRNRLSTKFLWDVLQQWEISGPAVLRIMAVERPAGFAKLVASVLPKELIVEAGGILADLSDEEIETFINRLQRTQPKSDEDEPDVLVH